MSLHDITAEQVVYFLIAVNFIAFAAFGLDKSLAETGGWRISEKTLLTWAFLGGSPGAYAGRALFRHKTRKRPFTTQLHMIAVLHFFAFGFLAIAYGLKP